MVNSYSPTQDPSGILEAHIIAEDYYDLEAMRHAERMARCGYYFWTYNPKTGMPQCRRESCGIYRECEKCRNERINGICLGLSEISSTENLYVMHTTPEIWTNVRKNVPGSDNFRCLPQMDGSVLAFMNVAMYTELATTKFSKHIQSINTAELQQKFNWSEIVITPTGKRVSGKLGLRETMPKQDYGQITINEVTLVKDGKPVPLYKTEEINNKVLAITADLDPKNIEELTAAINARTIVFIAEARKAGFDTFVQMRILNLTIDPNDLCWKESLRLSGALTPDLKAQVAAERQKFAMEHDLDPT